MSKVTENIGNSKTRGIVNPLCPRLLTIKQAAHYLGRGVDSLREMIYAGLFPVIQEGERSKIWLDKEDLDTWIVTKKRFMRDP